MIQLRVTNGFDKLSDPALQVRVGEILALMAGNSNFPDPVPTLPDVEDTLSEFSTAVIEAREGNRQDAAVKNELRAALILQMHNLSAYVLFEAQGDFVIATSSGIKVAKAPSPAPPITTPTGVKVAQGMNAGELDIKFEKVQSARSYMCQFTPSPITAESKWESKTTTVRKNTISNLQSGVRYWCRVAAVGIKNQIAYSEPVSRVVQ